MNKIKVLFMVVYGENMDDNDELGIGFIDAYLKQNGYETKLSRIRETDIEYYEILDFNPDIVGFSMYNDNAQAIHRVAWNIKRLKPSVKIAAGGAFATTLHKRILEEETVIDYIIRGEGEEVFLQLVRSLETGEGVEKVKGLTYRDNKGIVANEGQVLIKDLNILPWPTRTAFTDGNTYISTSRGCTQNCNFCVTRGFWNKWRGTGVKRIVGEIEHLASTHGKNYFVFTDNSFEDPEGNCSRGLDIANELIKRELGISYVAMFRAEFWKKATQETWDTLKRSGLIEASIGVETGNETDRVLYNKTATLEDNKKIVDVIRNNGIYHHVNFINFNPYSNFEGLHQNIDYLESVDRVTAKTLATVYMLIGNTRLYDKIKADGLLKDSTVSDKFTPPCKQSGVKINTSYSSGSDPVN